MPHHETITKFLSNPRIFLEKIHTENSPAEKWSKQSDFCQQAVGVFPTPRCPYVVMHPPKITVAKRTIVPAHKNILMREQI